MFQVFSCDFQRHYILRLLSRDLHVCPMSMVFCPEHFSEERFYLGDDIVNCLMQFNLNHFHVALWK